MPPEHIVQGTLFGSVEEGRALRDVGMARAAGAEPTWSQRARAWIEGQPMFAEFSADDLTFAIGLPEHTAAVGSAFGSAAKRKTIERAGLVQSTTPSSHASVIQIWRRT